ncbi:MAG: hypothetical protein LAT76_12530, partial [Schleiferiaceae bacterium]|nr:hypothetical protein [Schleiferiaceae bacterium]
LEESLTFGENTVQLNELALEFNGILKFLEDAMDIDLTFAVPSNDFKSVISLIPAYYYQDFEDLVAKGNFDLNGFVKGPYYYENEDYTPAFGFNVLAKNGTISYPDLPEKIENLHIDMSINHPGGDLDLMRVNLPTFALSLAKNPISGHFHVLTPFSDPNIDFGIKTKMDFSSLEKTLKTNDLNIKGLLDADFLFKGRLSHLENEAYDKVTASGGGKLSNFVFESAELDVPIKIAQAEAQLSPQFLNLPMFQMTIGKSDFSASGRLDNLLSYVFSDTTLIGRFQFNSNLIDANELLALMDDETENQAIAENPTETTTGAPSVPANLDFNLNATVEKLLFDVYDITDMKGQLVIANQKLTMNQLLMKTLGGAIEMNGFYETQPEQPPLANFGFDLLNLDLEQVFDKVETLKALAPIGAAAKGLLTTKFNFQSELDGDLSPVLSSIDAAGMFRTANIQYASPTLDKLASSLNNDSYKNLSFKNALIDFEITDGRIFLKPFNIALGSQQAEFSGSHGIDQTMAYKISGKFPAAQLASSAISLPSAERIKDVDLDVLIGGTITSPKISFELKSLGNALRDQVTDIVKDEIGKVVDNAKADAQARAAKLIADAEAKGDQLIAEAQRQANRLRSEAKNAGEKLVKEAQEGAAKLEREAGSNPLKQAAAKRAGDELVRKATAQATALEKEADTNGKRLVQEATNQKEQLVNDAKKKAELENQ